MVCKLPPRTGDLCKTIKLMVLCCLMLTWWMDVAWATQDFDHFMDENDQQYKTHLAQGKCEPITVTMCKDLQYNMTFFPNIMGQDRQDDVALEVHQYSPLVTVGCSPYLKLFLCTIYVPVCTSHDTPIPPCKEVCMAAKNGCESLMNKFGFQWPEVLNCDKFPPKNQFCVNPDHITTEKTPKTGQNSDCKAVTNSKMPPRYKFRKEPTCPQVFWAPKSYDNYEVEVYGQTLKDTNGYMRPCGMPCDDSKLFFSNSEQETVRIWIGVFAILSLVSTFFSVITCIIDRSRFRYPERPIIFLMFCYFIIALVFVIGFVWKRHDIACNEKFEQVLNEVHELKKGSGIVVGDLPRTVARGTKREWCAIFFMLLYFFYMASHMWWIILCLTWFLAAGLKWSHEAIENHSQYYHVCAWAIPALKTIIILALQKSEGDVLSNTCFVGVLDKDSLVGFVIIPLVAYLALGALFLILGMMSLFKIRTIVKHDGRETDRLEKLMARIGIFSVLYILANGVTIACYFYEMFNRERWIADWYLNLCRQMSSRDYLKFDTDFEKMCPDIDCIPPKDTDSRPELTIFMLKYFSILVIGLVSGLWVWSKKTCRVWGNCLCGGFSTQKYPQQRSPIVQL